MSTAKINPKNSLIVAGPLIVYRDLSRQSGAGRPGTIGEIETTKLEALLQLGTSVNTAALTAGISTRSYYRKYQADEQFRRKMDAARAFMKVKAHHTIAANLDRVEVAKWYLEHYDRKYYAPQKTSRSPVRPVEAQPLADVEAAARKFDQRRWSSSKTK